MKYPVLVKEIKRLVRTCVHVKYIHLRTYVPDSLCIMCGTAYIVCCDACYFQTPPDHPDQEDLQKAVSSALLYVCSQVCVGFLAF